MRAVDQEQVVITLKILHRARWWQVLDRFLIRRVTIELRDHLNNQLHNRDLRERLNDCRFHCDANQGRGNVHDGADLDLVNHQIHELQ